MESLTVTKSVILLPLDHYYIMWYGYNTGYQSPNCGSTNDGENPETLKLKLWTQAIEMP
mgnify:CR=1 FL=1